mmetsp:Transcript_7071/g.10400  ORF Transcript_7071/g.10400 Transcript_7071/m.10400 type:complete len:704 (+) Transcript_7071:422-2533(+)
MKQREIWKKISKGQKQMMIQLTKQRNIWSNRNKINMREKQDGRTYSTNLKKQTHTFKVQNKYIESYKNGKIKPNFGFNGLGEVVYHRTYARESKGRNEQWHETVERVVNGTFNLQKKWKKENNIQWNEEEEQKKAKKMYEKIFKMKFLPPGRGLWAMGSEITEEREIYAALNNCAFVSTEKDPVTPFCFLMDLSMLGVGVGFDTKGKENKIYEPKQQEEKEIYKIPDSREGWVQSIRLLLNSYFKPNQKRIEFDYTKIRGKGEPIKGFGGISAGPEPLVVLHKDIREVCDSRINKNIGVRGIVDIMNMIGRCVVSGNVRQSAEIAFGEHDDQEFIELKRYDKHPERASYGWTSNNSIYAKIGMNYDKIAESIKQNGEPGLAWLENMQNFSRMGYPADYKDEKASGGNPCLEQTLESYEMCCLVETFPHNHESLEDYLETLEYAFLYAKTVTLATTHWDEANYVMQRNRRIGTSMSGIAQFVESNGLNELKKWCEEGFDYLEKLDQKLSNDFRVPLSIKRTSIKPSGTVSLLAGATPGLHYPDSRYYIRRLRMNKSSPLLSELTKSNYPVEDCVVDKHKNTAVVSFPVDVGPIKTTPSMWEQLEMASFLQAHWSDNQVSCTVTFDPESEGDLLSSALDFYQFKLKGISFLPRLDSGAYPQMPYESISADAYQSLKESLLPFSMAPSYEEPLPDKYCDGDTCQVF